MTRVGATTTEAEVAVAGAVAMRGVRVKMDEEMIGVEEATGAVARTGVGEMIAEEEMTGVEETTGEEVMIGAVGTTEVTRGGEITTDVAEATTGAVERTGAVEETTGAVETEKRVDVGGTETTAAIGAAAGGEMMIGIGVVTMTGVVETRGVEEKTSVKGQNGMIKV